MTGRQKKPPRHIRLCGLAMMLLATAAAAEPHYWDTTLASWNGRPAIELWRAWGVPSRILPAPNGNEIHIYVASPRGSCGSSSAAEPQPCMSRVSERNDGCESSFEVAADKTVVGWYWRGRSCPGALPGPRPRPWFVPIGF